MSHYMDFINIFTSFSDFIHTTIKKGDIDEARRRWKPQFKGWRYSDGWTVLHWACLNTSGDRGGLVKLLVSLGCDIEAETDDHNGWRPLHVCAICRSLEAMRALLEAGCSLFSLTKDGHTPLMYADAYRYHECASLLRSAIDAAHIQGPSKTNYKEGDLLGKGAFGSVFKCHDPHIDMYFAIKKVPILETNANVENEDIKALQNEVQIYSKLNYHRRIVRYFGTKIHKGEMIIFIEYVSNGSLKDSLQKSGPFSIKSIVKYSKQILEGLEFLHEQKIIHRDIKAANILRDSKDDIKLADFGISKFVKSISSGSKGFTAAGTANWMAPEVIKAQGNERYDYKADVWSLGATILEMLTGNPPFHKLKPMQVAYQISICAPVDSYFPPNLDHKTKSFLENIFVYDPLKRADVKALLESSFFQDI